MKKILSILMILALLAACVSAGAETVVDAESPRNITITPAGANEVPANISPVTGRNLAELPVPDGFLGMATDGIYFPVMVQHNGFASGTGNSSPWNGSYADVFYEQPKAQTGYTRMTMLFNDMYPQYVGASRSIRVGHVWNRQEWDAMLLYAGQQEAVNERYNTNVLDAFRELKVGLSGNPNVPLDQRRVFNALDGSRPWTDYRYRVRHMPSSYNVVWDLQLMSMKIFNRELTFPNHTWKFAEDLPQAGDDASRVYVMYNKNKAGSGNADVEDGAYYFNSMFEYDEDENVYYRYFLTSLNDAPTAENTKLFTELAPTNIVRSAKKEDGWYRLECEPAPGEAITFSNVIVQMIDMKWPSGEQPYPILTGEGNADYFMGGKHISGVWKRDTYNDRTVFYGEDGQEIALQPGKTIILQLDYNTVVGGDKVRQLKYE